MARASGAGYAPGVALRLAGYYLPDRVQRNLTPAVRTFGDVQVDVPSLQPQALTTVIACLAQSGERLRARSVDAILGSIDGVVAGWLAPKSQWRELAERALPSVTGFSPQMIRHGLPTLLAPLRGEQIGALLDAELTQRRILDARPGPRLIVHVLSGNIPGLASVPLVLSLAVRSPALVKTAAGDPVFAPLFAASLAEQDPELAASVAVAHWGGGDAALEAVAFAAAELVVASGADATIAAIAAKAPGRVIGHGHKISFAVDAAECLADAAAGDVARRLAYDVALWDQQGCLSPQVCFVEADRARAQEFAGRLAAALREWASELPPRRMTLAEKAAVWRFREEAEWTGVPLYASPDASGWSVTVEEGVQLLPTCLNRCVRVVGVPDLAMLATALRPHRQHLEATGMAIGAARREAVTAMLSRCGVHRVCPLGTMQLPTLAWQPGGRPRIADWVNWSGGQAAGDARRA